MKKIFFVLFAISLLTCSTLAAADLFKGLDFREIGPAVMGGRIDDFAVVESNPDVFYVGSASGGVLKTTNGGNTWQPVFDDEVTSSIGDVTVAPGDPSVVWVGTGESNNRQSGSWGNGVYKSTDAGATWTHMGLDKTMHIGRIVISPADSNVVYVAAAGDLWGPSADRGVFKTTDGGKTWSKVLFINDDTGVNDIAMDPQSPGTLIAAAYQRRRTVFGFAGSGPGSALYKTTDGGATWKKLEKGLPWDPEAKPARGRRGDNGEDPKAEREQVGRIGVNFYRRDPNVVYALIEAANGGIFRSDDHGESWTKMSDTDPRGSYYSQVVIDPNNDQRIWVLGASMYTSDDGGRTFKTNVVQRIHGDYHAMWIDPANSNHMITGSDGGIYSSHDRGRSWDYLNNFPLGQFYEIGLDMQRPYRICGGLQDNNVWCGPSATFDQKGITNSDWFTIGGGDGFYAQIDPNDPNTVYTESQDGNLLRRNLVTHESRFIRPVAPEGERYRFQWNTPIVVSAFDSHTIYYGGNYLFKSTNRGDDWTRLGPDLTNNEDRDKLPIMGRVTDKYTMSRFDGVEDWPAITTVSESPLNRELLYAGTDDGNLQVTRDGGKSWKNVAANVTGVPKGTYVSRVVASRFHEGTAYATFDGHRSNDFNVYVYVTNDYGATWKAMKNGLPDDMGTVHVIREHFRNPKLLFLGTEHGLFISTDAGSKWMRIKSNLPTVPVDDIAIHPRDNDMVLATHGRSLWILDDITPLEQMTEVTPTEDLHLFDMRTSTEWRVANRTGVTGHQVFYGPNPPNGAIVTYFLKNKPERGKVKIAISDSKGKVIRTMDGTDDAGFNRVTWDFRTDSITKPARKPETEAAAARSTQGGTLTPESETEPGSQEGTLAGRKPERGLPSLGGGGGFGGFQGGLRVEPGVYTVKVTAGKLTDSKTVTVEDDPRLQLSAADRAARLAAIEELAPMATRATTARRDITGLRNGLDDAIKAWKKSPDEAPPEAIRKSAEDLLTRVTTTCLLLASPQQCGERPATLGNAGPAIKYIPPAVTQRILQLTSSLENYAAAPSATQLDQIKILSTQLRDATAATQKLVTEDLPALNKQMRDANVPYIVSVRGVTGNERRDDEE